MTEGCVKPLQSKRSGTCSARQCAGENSGRITSRDDRECNPSKFTSWGRRLPQNRQFAPHEDKVSQWCNGNHHGEPCAPVFPLGTPVWQQFEYKLWDAEMLTSCVCDPPYTGHFCDKRRCPIGADPLQYLVTGPKKSWTDASTTLDHEPQAERQIFFVGATQGLPSGNFSIRFNHSVYSPWSSSIPRTFQR